MKKNLLIVIVLLFYNCVILGQLIPWTQQPVLHLDAKKNIYYTEPGTSITKTIFPVMLYSFPSYDEVTIPPVSIWNEGWGFNMVFSWDDQSKILSNCNSSHIISNIMGGSHTLFSGIYAFPDEPMTSNTNTVLSLSTLKNNWLIQNPDALGYVNFDIYGYFYRKNNDPDYDGFDSKISLPTSSSELSYTEGVSVSDIISFDFYPYRPTGVIDRVVLQYPSEQTSVGEFTQMLKVKYPGKAVWAIIQSLWYDPWTAPYSGYYINAKAIRKLTFESIINGADGVSFWGHGEIHRSNSLGGTSITTQEADIWKSVLYQTVELKELQEKYDNILLNDNFNPLAFKNRFIEYSFKQAGNTNKFYLFSVNNSSVDVKSKIKLPKGYRLSSTPVSIGKYFIPRDNIENNYINPNAFSTSPVLGKNSLYLNFTGYGTNIASFTLKKTYPDIAFIYKELSSPNYTAVHLFKSQTNGSSLYQHNWANLSGGNLLDPDQVVKAVAGDFNNDGNDDIALIYRYPASNNKTRVHLLKSNSSGGFNYQYSWSIHDYGTDSYLNTNQILHAVTGDYDKDGKDDIALVYKQLGTPNSTQIHLIKSNSSGTSTYQKNWANLSGSNLLDPDQIITAVSGDFDNDGNDDIAVILRNNNITQINLIKSGGSGGFIYQQNWSTPDNGSGDYLNPSYVINAVTGDYDNDGKDDIALIYKDVSTSPYSTHIHLVKSNLSGISSYHKDWAIFSQSTGNLLDPDQVVKAVSGDFNNDGNDDIALIYRYPASNNKTCTHLVKSNGSGGNSCQFSWAVNDGIVNNFLNTNLILHAVAGDFSNAGISKDVANEFQQEENDLGETRVMNYKLFQNYPNPFNPSTTIRYNLPKEGKVVIKIYDILGREIAILIDEYKQAGSYSEIWNGKDSFGTEVTSGVYFYNIRYNDQSLTNKMMLVR